MRPAEFIKKLSDNPRFVKAKRSGRAYIIVGAKPSVPEEAMKTWFISGKMAGRLIARADDEFRSILPGEQFLGIPFAKLKVGLFIEEKPLGKGQIVAAQA